MPRLKAVGARRQDLAWFVTVPAAALTIALAFPLAVGGGQLSSYRWPEALLYLVLFGLAQSTLLHLEIQRQSVAMVLAEIPLVLGLFYVPPLELIVVRVLASIAVQIYQRFSLIKQFFNAAAVALSTTVACLVMHANRPPGVGPAMWLVLSAAVFAAMATSLITVIAVISLVQGRRRCRGSSVRSCRPPSSPRSTSRLV